MSDIIFIFWFVVIIFIFLILITFAWAGLIAAPWVPLWKKDVKRMLDLAGLKPGETVYDLGAGDGRIIIMAAKDYQAKAIGFEFAILPYLLGYIKIVILGLRGKAWLKYADFFKQDFSKADVICIFLTPGAMEKLKTKLKTEKKPSCRIVSYAFSIPGWQPEKIDKPNKKSAAIYIYR